MPPETTAPYGSWRSPITAGDIASAGLRLSQPEIADDVIYWKELRPAEGGRCVIVNREGETTRDIVPAPFNVRSRVHEYGGGAYFLSDRTVFFSNFADQRLYRIDGDSTPRPVTPEADMRYADGVVDRARNRMICVREDHTVPGREPANSIVAIDLENPGTGEVLVSGNDFYAAPRLSPDGAQLAWLTWNHPSMPWDAAELWLAAVHDNGALGEPCRVAGGAAEAAVQPEWSPAGELYFASDRTDWWNLYRFRNGRVGPVTEMEAEFARPMWQFRMSSYAFAGRDRIVCAYTQNGVWRLATIDTTTRELRPIETPYNAIADLVATDTHVAFIGGSSREAPALVKLSLDEGAIEVLRRSSTLAVDRAWISEPQPIEFPTENGATAHGLFYAPRNPDCAAPAGEKPPLLVMIHGGPTSATSASLRLGIQYYTTRGIAVLDVNYGGSTGYGRAYRERLYGQWGVVDVDDCVNGARHLADRGWVDAQRLAITGGSAGGYTVLSALTFRNAFHAGASHYGVSDCEALARETHKFESRYLDTLIGPYPERRDLYVERSPIHHVERLSCPVIFFQGLEDKIVPRNQAEKMAAALRERGIPVAYVPFEGEQHGFRKAENIRRALEAELYFLGRVFGFELADPVEPLDIDNL